MSFLLNADLLSVGIAIAANLLLGFVVLFSETKSATNRLFFLQTFSLSIWSLVNFLSYQANSDPELALRLVRLVLFFAVPNSIFFMLFMHTFPNKALRMKRVHLYSLLLLMLVTMIATLTPAVFTGVDIIPGQAPKPSGVGLGILLFILSAVLSVVVGIFFLVYRYTKSDAREKKPLRYLLYGVAIMFALILSLDFVLPTFFQNTRFIPLSAVFTLPFVFMAAYAIIKHGLLNIKVVATEILTFILAVVTFIEIIFSDDLAHIIFRSSVFTLVLVFGILLIKSVRREVEQRERIEVLAKELSVANDKLRELDKQKTEFLSIASHQLRAPLTAIKGYSSMLLENSFGDISEKVRGAVDVIFQSSQKLVAVIEDFLNITRIELGRMKYELAQVDMRQLVETAVKELQNQIKARGLSLKVEIPEGIDFRVTADAGKIAQVIGNLIDNATKYTKQGGITISLSRPLGTGKVRLTIADTGVGMTPGAHAQLFQKFTRAKDAGKVNIIGTGLGLYVAKQIIEGHNGRIWAESAGPGKGSTFYVEL